MARTSLEVVARSLPSSFRFCLSRRFSAQSIRKSVSFTFETQCPLLFMLVFSVDFGLSWITGRCCYGPKHDLSLYLCSAHLNDWNVQNLRTADGPNCSSESQIAKNVPILPLHYRHIQSKLSALRKVIQRRINLCLFCATFKGEITYESKRSCK